MLLVLRIALSYYVVLLLPLVLLKIDVVWSSIDAAWSWMAGKVLVEEICGQLDSRGHGPPVPSSTACQDSFAVFSRVPFAAQLPSASVHRTPFATRFPSAA
jgi:hypothetical protein